MRDFEWRSALGPWRWLILGSVGLNAAACGGRSQTEGLGIDNASLENTGGTNQGGVGGDGGSPAQGGTGGDVLVAFGGSENVGYGGSSYFGNGGTGAHVPPPRCDAPVALGGGWVRCANGMMHRAALGTCPSNLPRPDRVELPEWYEAPPGVDAGAPPSDGSCRYDSDCTAAPYGHCDFSSYEGLPYCAYGCATNADCGAGATCLCGPNYGACLPTVCGTNADCQDGYYCANYSMEHACGGMEFGCQTSLDQCVTDDDCTDGVCTIDQATGGRVCAQYICVTGRPFLVEGQERLASTVERCDWYAHERVDPLSNGSAAGAEHPELRAALAEGWLEQGLMEHASVAAFARFTLQLLALGAPAELVQKSAVAMQDEIRHARDCFALARRHLDHDVGPGPLPVEHALDHCDLESVVIGSVLEGCIGETVAAIEASEALAHCEDASARVVLERIAAEETRHAELAWQFVGWALERGSESLRARVETTFAGELLRPREPVAALSAVDGALSRRGLLPAALRRDLRARVLSEVIAPCARALLANLSRPAAATGNGRGEVARHGAPEPRAPRISPAA